MGANDIELTVLMPCLDEVETLGICISKAKNYLQQSNISGEILISDNGSTDGSQDLARKMGARVIHAKEKGYGAALWFGINNAKGKYVIMGDADDSYDFSNLDSFLNSLRSGNELVMGNRFQGGIEKGAMPPLHKFIGNPILSFLGRLFFNIPCKDFHCGMRGFNKESILKLKLHTTGMEFASEMIVSSAIKQLKIDEVPTTLSIDGRSRPPHLNTWRDGWRHLCFLLMYTPKWLFIYPSIILFILGLFTTVGLILSPVNIHGINFSNNTFFAGCLSLLISIQCISMGVVVRRYSAERGFLPSPRHKKIIDRLTLENTAFISIVIICIGLTLGLWCIYQWSIVGFSDLDSMLINRTMVLSMCLIATGVQAFFTAFVGGIISINKK
ncbi:glycosyltransferase family 2 protein [Vibrio breoganii]|uniref:glycosyltransferase family 2 protein n=1 Tax=Vibrio breoganii TaxID=553239 RepID=UPI000C8225FC|nr:glycosyltransferase family 2 protein [Vibrio breoganii]PML15651.1 dolichol-P-glucose synthetase [Vibrio breoganii]